MTISEIILQEKGNRNTIFLRKEGLFYRAYELSACLFVKYIQSYAVTKKYVKAAQQEVVYIGFPVSYLPKILQNINENCVLKHDSSVEIGGFAEPENYWEWRQTIALTFPNSKTEESKKEYSIELTVNQMAVHEVEPVYEVVTGKQYQRIIEKIQKYPIATKSPVEAQQFLIEIQYEINGIIS